VRCGWVAGDVVRCGERTPLAALVVVRADPPALVVDRAGVLVVRDGAALEVRDVVLLDRVGLLLLVLRAALVDDDVRGGGTASANSLSSNSKNPIT